MAVPGRNDDGQIAYPELSPLVCGPCNDGGEDIAAAGFCVDCNEYLCELCFQSHNRARPFRDHKLQYTSTNERPCQQFSNSNSNANVCCKHEGERVRFYCRNHRELGCGSCIIKTHKSCEDIVDVSDEYDSFSYSLNRLKEEFTKQADHAEENSPRIEQIKDDAVDAIKTFHREIIEISNKLENASLQEIEELRNQDSEKVKAISANCASNLQDIDLLRAVLGTLFEGKRTGELLMKLKENQSQISQLETDLRTIQRDNTINEYTFESSDQLSAMLQRLDSLGTVTAEKAVKSEQPTEEVSGAIKDMKYSDDAGQSLDDSNVFANEQLKSQKSYGTNKGWIVATVVVLIAAVVISVQFSNSSVGYLEDNNVNTDQENNNPKSPGSGILNGKKLEYFRSIVVKTGKDSEPPLVSGLGIVGASRLIVGDYSNQKVKLLDTKIAQVTSELKLYAKVLDATVIDVHKVAVTLPSVRSIQFVLISDKLSLGLKIKTRGECYGITYWDNKLAVTCQSATTGQWSLDILDLTGNVLRSVSPEYNGQYRFSEPMYITVGGDHELELYVSDRVKKAVYRLSVQGEVKTIYKHPDLRWPVGLTAGPGGTLYVCDWLSHSVFQLDPNSDGMQKVLGKDNRVKRPHSVSYGGHKLYIGTDGTGKVQVFHLR